MLNNPTLASFAGTFQVCTERAKKNGVKILPVPVAWRRGELCSDYYALCCEYTSVEWQFA